MTKYSQYFSKRTTAKLTLTKLLIASILIFTNQNIICEKNNSQATYEQVDEKTKNILVNINVNQNDFVYQDYINISCDNPHVEIVSWSTNATPVKHFSKEFRDTKNIFNKNFVIKIKARKNTSEYLHDAHLHISYHLNSKNAFVEEIVRFESKPGSNNCNSNKAGETCDNKNCKSESCEFEDLSQCKDLTNETIKNNANINTAINTESDKSQTSNTSNNQNNGTERLNQSPQAKATDDKGYKGHEKLEQDAQKSSNNNMPVSKNTNGQAQTWTQYLQDLLKKTESIWIRLLLALILGILLSLTPCIYPMIPITVGIVQSHGSKSFLSNLFLSLIYSMGIAITFAILGLVAAFTGAIFGTILANPIFVLIVVALMVYMALSMFGFYEIYTPKFMRTSGGADSKKSILSVFLLGIVSGTIASPCVSPGLILLLSIVTAIGSKLLGFLLLFTFGLGLSTPLIIAGTFSGSINKLPRAGMWMLEIKKIFGLLIFGVCFYFLSNIMPTSILLWVIASFMIAVGVFYLYTIKPYDSPFWKLFKNIIGVIFCTASVMLIFNIYKEKYITQNLQNTQGSQVTKFWQEDFDAALNQAKTENKKLFIDLTTDSCSICKAIGKKVFTNQSITNELKDKFVNVKVTVADMSKEPFATLNKKFKILGFPTFLLVDPNTDALIQRWSSEFYYMSQDELIKLFKELN